jgi:NADH dehydrogenase (ubiquinone) 1 alpha subcomplex subunit 5
MLKLPGSGIPIYDDGSYNVNPLAEAGTQDKPNTPIATHSPLATIQLTSNAPEPRGAASPPSASHHSQRLQRPPKMRGTLRLLASVKPVRFLEPGAPTGLTGLFANPSPRATLLYLYSSTLDRLRAVPESSLYRQSVEAVTKHRMSLVQSVKPAGYDEWLAKAQAILEKHPEHFKETAHKTADGSLAAGLERGGKFFVMRRAPPDMDSRYNEWDGEEDEGPEKEGSRTLEERKDQALISSRNPFEGEGVEWTDEPQLTIDQYVRPTRFESECAY